MTMISNNTKSAIHPRATQTHIERLISVSLAINKTSYILRMLITV